MRVSSECSAPSGRRRPRRAGPRVGSTSPGCSRRMTRSGSTHGILSARLRTHERVERVVERAALALDGEDAPHTTSSPAAATPRRAASSAGARCEDHTTRTPPGRSAARAAASPARRRGARSGCTRKPGPLSTSRSTAPSDPRAGAPDRRGRPRRRGRAGAARSLEAGELGHQPSPGPVDERRRQLDDVDVVDARVREHGAGREAQSQPADEHATRRAVAAQRRGREDDLGGGVHGVHGERVSTTSSSTPRRRRSATSPCAVSTRARVTTSGPSPRSRGTPTAPVTHVTVRTRRAGTPVVTHRHTRPSCAAAADRQRRSRPSSLSSRRTASPEPGPKAG